MSTSAAQAEAFYREFVREGAVWAVRDSNGFPAPVNGDGVRAMPSWSLESRAELVIQTAPAYAEFTVTEIPRAEWRERWIPRLGRDGLLVGLNWPRSHSIALPVSRSDSSMMISSSRDGLGPCTWSKWRPWRRRCSSMQCAMRRARRGTVPSVVPNIEVWVVVVRPPLRGTLARTNRCSMRATRSSPRSWTCALSRWPFAQVSGSFAQWAHQAIDAKPM